MNRRHLNQAIGPYTALGMDFPENRIGHKHTNSVKFVTDYGTFRLRGYTVKTYLPELWRKMLVGWMGSHRHGRLHLDFHHLPRYSDGLSQSCLRRLFEYLEDLEIRGGQSTFLFDRLDKTLKRTLPELDRREAFHCDGDYSITEVFGTFGSLFDERHFGNHSTIFHAMEAFFIHRSPELCQMLHPAEIMTYVAALDGMRGHMTSTLASLKAGMGGGRRLQSLLQYCRGELWALRPSTLHGLMQMTGGRLGDHGGRRHMHDGHIPLRRHHDWDDNVHGHGHGLGHGLDQVTDVIPQSLVRVHQKLHGDVYTYTTTGAPRGMVRVILRHMGHGRGQGLGLGLGLHGHHHHHHHHHRQSPLRGEAGWSDDDLFAGPLDFDGHRDDLYRGQFARSPRRRSFSDDSDVAPIGGLRGVGERFGRHFG